MLELKGFNSIHKSFENNWGLNGNFSTSLIEKDTRIFDNSAGRAQESLITFKIRFETTHGENLAVSGDNFVHNLTWSEGHVWYSEQPLKMSKDFDYKYMIWYSNTEEARVEGGLSRTCRVNQPRIELNDTWEKMNITFKVRSDEDDLELVIVDNDDQETSIDMAKNGNKFVSTIAYSNNK